jgi:LruC domain-containing protein
MMKKLINAAFLGLVLAACNKKDVTNGSNPYNNNGKVAPDGFTYKTTKDVQIDFTLLGIDNKFFPNVLVDFYSYSNGNKGNLIYKGITDANGKILQTISIPSFSDTVVIDANTSGVIRFAKAFISGNSLSCSIGGLKGFSGNIVNAYDNFASTNKRGPFTMNEQVFATATTPNFSYLNTFDALGVPSKLFSPSDIISQQVQNYINYTVPERVSILTHNPALYSGSYSNDVSIIQESDFYITFVQKTTANKNAIGYFVYPTSNPPKSVSAIDSIRIVFPNASPIGSGGGLTAGNKVFLGHYKAGTSIGFMILAGGWSGSSDNFNAPAYFTNPIFNPETDSTKKKHSVYFEYNNTFFTSFEDGNRMVGSCDNDFNDCTFYTTTSVTNSIDTTTVAPINIPVDSDGDGVLDLYDAYPNDASRAYNNYYPSQSQYGTYAFEDNWPNVGDYDMNDLVVSYRYKLVSNAQNKVVDIYADFAPIAIGASFHNGFGIQIPNLLTSDIQSYKDSINSNKNVVLATNTISLASNGTEKGQSSAVFIPFDDAKALLNNPDGYVFVNSDPTHNKVIGDTAHVHIILTTPKTTTQLGSPSTFNPFCIANGSRPVEVHLPGFLPTSLANTSLFGTGVDATNPAKGIYYVTQDNHPFGINFSTGFTYPTETTPINNAYLHFFDWSQSNGTLYTDWYSNTAAGYRTTSLLYTK